MNESVSINLPVIYLLKVNNRNTRTRCKICSKLTIKAPEQRQWRRFAVFIVNFEYISNLVLVSVVISEHVIAGWVVMFVLKNSVNYDNHSIEVTYYLQIL